MVSRLRSRKDVVLLPEWDARALGHAQAAEDEVLLGVEYGDLAGALRRLSPEFRSVVQAVVLDGLTTKEAGRLLGVRENTVKTRLHRAKAQLRGSLAQTQPDTGTPRRDGDDDPGLARRPRAPRRRTSPGRSTRSAAPRSSSTSSAAPTAAPRSPPTSTRPHGAGPGRTSVTPCRAPRSRSPIRLARRLGVSEPTSILLAATASLRTAWLAGAFVALGFATLAVGLAGKELIAPFLLVAPMVPVLGVAAAYGPHEDPLEALVVTAPYGRSRLILLRTLAVLVSVLPVTALLGLLLPGPLWLAAAWLGPALALVPVLLALSSFVGPRIGGAVVSIAWSGIVLLSVRELPATWPVEATQQLVYLALAARVVSAVLAVRARRDRLIGATL